MKHFNNFETVILVGGSKVKLNTLKAISNKHSVYAADSGANILIDEQINFESVIGDMDSIDSKILKNKNHKAIFIEDQNSTDLQKCLNTIKAKMFIGFGFLDQRLDHTLASLTAICQHNVARAIILVGEIDTVIFVQGEWSCSIPSGTRLSVWPLSNQLFLESSGLKYSLNNLNMDPINLIGTSNETVKDKFSIKPSDRHPARYVTIIPSKYFMNIYDEFINF